MKNLPKTMLTALALAAAAGSAQAQWALTGDATVNAATGTIVLTTAYTDGEDAPFNVSGSPAAWIDQLEPAAGVPYQALDLPDEPAYEGSVATQSFQVQAGQTLNFFYQFSTEETRFQDLAFLVINGTVLPLARAGAGLPPQGLPYSFLISGTGTMTVGFGVVDTGDVNGVSRLTVSQIAIAPVPEPATWALALAGAAGLGALRRRRRQR